MRGNGKLLYDLGSIIRKSSSFEERKRKKKRMDRYERLEIGRSHRVIIKSEGGSD